MKHRRVSDRMGFLAAFFLALVSLAVALYQTYQVYDMREGGHRTVGEVAGLHRGVKGGKKAVVRYKDDTGTQKEARGLFFTHFVHDKAGDTVQITYNRKYPREVLIERGPWTYVSPAAFYCGFFFMAALGFFILRQMRRQELR